MKFIEVKMLATFNAQAVYLITPESVHVLALNLHVFVDINLFHQHLKHLITGVVSWINHD